METSRKLLCTVYGGIALAALVATWSQNVAYFGGGNPLAGLADFWKDTRANPASQSITADILLFALAATVFMVIEARKHQIKFVWAYIIGGVFIAVSVTFPLFLIARELALTASDAPRLRPLDTALLGIVAIGTAAFVIWIDIA